MSANPLQQLHDAGQSIWLDFIERTMVRNGELARRVREDCLTGMTSNPTIFEKALAEGTAYDEQIRTVNGEFTALALFELIATTDVRDACDVFRGVYADTKGEDGYVSIEVSPGAANDVGATVSEATRLWETVARPNVLVKVPGTVQGAAAVRMLTRAGISINITLLFSLDAYARVIDAYMSGLEERLADGGDISAIHSVASFFVSRVDTEVDKRLDELLKHAEPDAVDSIRALHGKAAIANAKLAYQLFLAETSTDRWKAIAAKGGTPQRPLWASTSTKNPAYRDVLYVESLIGPHTVDTMPLQTIDAFRDHGEVRRTIDGDVDQARRDLEAIEGLGISMHDVTDKLLVEGLASFQKSFDTLLAGLEKKTAALGRDLVASR
jgi:transaldolase